MVKAELNHKLTYCPSNRVNGVFDVGLFVNVIPYDDGYIGACRSGSTSLDDMIDILYFDENLKLLKQDPITGGEDPRCFFYNDTPYALTWKPQGAAGSNHFIYKLINLKTEEITILKIEGVPETPVSRLGKNWIPIVKDNCLFLVITMDPELIVFKCDVSTGNCTWHTPYRDDLPITISRGGTCCLFDDEHGVFFGLGHRTYDCHNHQPYLYTISEDLQNITIGPDLLPSVKGVHDPLSLFKKDGKYFTSVAFFPIQAGDTMEGHSDLYEVNLI